MVSIIIPYIRPKGKDRCVEAIRKNAGVPESSYEIITEQDTKRIGVPKMVKLLTARAKGDAVMFLADDTIPQPDFLRNALLAMKSLPDGWGMVGLNDMFYDGSVVMATHWLCHKKLLPYLDGEFFHTGYLHCYCDNELTARCRKLGRYIWAEDAKVLHNRPVVVGAVEGGQPSLSPLADDDYMRVHSPEWMRHDQKLYEERRRIWEDVDGNGEIPEFKAEYAKAFLALMLHKLGGSQTIPLKLLKKFPPNECPKCIWEPKLKAFTLKAPKAKKRKRKIIKPSQRLIV